jgi:hypothetical protein
MRTRDMLGKMFTTGESMFAWLGGARLEDAQERAFLDGRVPFLVVEVMSIPQRRQRYVRILQAGTSAWIAIRSFQDDLRPVGDCQ